MVITSAADLSFRLDETKPVRLPQRVLMTTPEHFTVEYVINPHMEGKVGTVNRSRAAEQWAALKDTYDELGIETIVQEGAEGFPDMVFCANQTLPFLEPDADRLGVFLSRMHAEERKGEVAYYERLFGESGYDVHPLPDSLDTDFEGMGDAIWHPGRFLLYGGYGFRTELDAYHHISETIGVPIVALHLDDPSFYHLDTCFSALDEKSVLIYPGAFDEKGLELIRRLFDTVIEAPEEEAMERFACNAHCPDQQHVIIQRGCPVTNDRLREAGFTPVEVDTDEFLKSGGSVFCMKLMVW